MASSQPVTALQERTWEELASDHRISQASQPHVSSLSQRSQQTDLQRSEEQQGWALNPKESNSGVTLKLLLLRACQETDKDSQGEAAAISGQDPDVSVRHPDREKGTAQEHGETPDSAVTNSLISPRRRAKRLYGHHSCHAAEKSGFSLKALPGFEG